MKWVGNTEETCRPPNTASTFQQTDPMSPDQLPHLEGVTLEGRTVRLPEHLPAHQLVLIIGFTHEARSDVGAWKQALAARQVPFLSLPMASVDLPAIAMEGVANAMRTHVPREAWAGILQVHLGGPALKATFGWQADDFAKVIRVSPGGLVLSSHDSGAFTESALDGLL